MQRGAATGGSAAAIRTDIGGCHLRKDELLVVEPVRKHEALVVRVKERDDVAWASATNTDPQPLVEFDGQYTQLYLQRAAPASLLQDDARPRLRRRFRIPYRAGRPARTQPDRLLSALPRSVAVPLFRIRCLNAPTLALAAHGLIAPKSRPRQPPARFESTPTVVWLRGPVLDLHHTSDLVTVVLGYVRIE